MARSPKPYGTTILSWSGIHRTHRFFCIMKMLVSAISLALVCGPAFSDVTRLTIDTATLSKSSGWIFVSGTIVCSSGEEFTVGVTITQIKGPNLAKVEGPGNEQLVCTDNPVPWTFQSFQPWFPTPFGPGNANAQISTFPSPPTGDFQLFSKKVSLRSVP
jgi:hypothetical protein